MNKTTKSNVNVLRAAYHAFCSYTWYGMHVHRNIFYFNEVINYVIFAPGEAWCISYVDFFRTYQIKPYLGAQCSNRLRSCTHCAHSAAIDVSEANGEPDIVWLVAMIATAVLAVSTQNSRYDKPIPYRLLPTNSICKLHFQIAAPSVRFDL